MREYVEKLRNSIADDEKKFLERMKWEREEKDLISSDDESV